VTGPVTLGDYESAAQARVPKAAWEYIHSGAGDEHTLRWNRERFGGLALSPRMLNDVRAIDSRIRLLGCDLAHPILLAPVAAHSIAHPDGEVATALGARAANAGMVLSSYTSRRVEEVAATGVAPLWFQLYIQEQAATRELVNHVVDRGCSALCVTVDTPRLGARDRLARSGFEFPPLPYRTNAPGDNPCTWDDIAWIRDAVRVPVILKGILHPEDAERAVRAGADAIIVSNHGGRNLDTAPAAIDALPGVLEGVRGRVPVLVDGGIRRGTDVVKALALGAAAVLIGRPYVYGLAVGGAEGVADVVGILRRELEQAMALLGRASVTALDRSVLWP
jgi:4-hydroxymandelate oxidase